MQEKSCPQCKTPMIENLYVGVESGMYHFVIKQKRKGFMNNVTEKLYAAVCPKCGNVSLYVNNSSQFS